MPQPIDMQTELGRVAAAERIALISDRASLAAQTRVAEEAALERQAAETEVEETRQKSDEVDEELKRKQPFTGRRKKRGGDAEEGEGGEERDRRDAGSRPVIPTDGDEHGLDISV